MNPSPVDHPFEADRLNGAADFRPEWDVPSAGSEVSHALNKDVDAVRANPVPHGGRKIHFLIGPSGYGKTHLFGRVLHAQRDRVQFVYVPMTCDPARVAPVDHIRWGVVETLFHPTGTYAPLRRHLARLLAPSFAAYFDQLPDSLQARCRPIRTQLDADPTSVLELLGPVLELPPYHALAASVRRGFPGLSAGVIQALVLGLSPAADDVRTWLRGESETLAEDRLRELLLADTAPDATTVLQAIGTLLQQIDTPLLLCLDQTEWLMQKDASAFRDLTAALMSWLQQVPNLVLVLGCMSDAWGHLGGQQAFAAFLDRTKAWKLYQLSPDESVEVVVRRMRSWIDWPTEVSDGWPFDLGSLKEYVGRTPPGPRGLLQLCDNAFDKWLAEGRKDTIQFQSVPPPPPPPVEALLKEWAARLDTAKQTVKAAVNYQEAELWDGLREAVEIARRGRLVPDGVRIEKITPQALKKVPKDDRPSANLDLIVGDQRFPVVLAVSKKDGGTPFSAWCDALEQAIDDPVVGAVVVWPKAQLAVGKGSKAYLKYRDWIEAGKVRPFPLDENADTFHQLETLRVLIRDAESDNLLLGARRVSAEECRRLLVEAQVLAKLKLFEMLFNWPVVEAALAAVKPPAPAPPPVAGTALATATAPTLTAVTAAVPPSSAPAIPLPPQPAPSVPVASAGTPGATATVPDDAVASPPTDSSSSPKSGAIWAQAMLDLVVQRLRSKGQPVRPAGFHLGPTFVRLKVEPRDDTDFAKVKKQSDNLKLHLALEEKPLIANQAGYISIDIRRPDRQTVPLGSLLKSRPDGLTGQPAFLVGVDVTGKPHWLNLADPGTCHLLIAGTTGSGKSEFLKALLAGLANHLDPHQLQCFLIDPKQVTFNFPGASPYLRGPVVYDAEKAMPIIEQCHEEMERRYTLLRKRGKEHVGELTGADAVPRWVVLFDEFADLMADRVTRKELEVMLKRIGAKARAAGIHLVLGTQRPEASVVTPLLRSNLPGRISLHVISEKDSKLILSDQPDAAYLLGKGDLFWWHGGGLIRLQSPFVAKPELAKALRFH